MSIIVLRQILAAPTAWGEPATVALRDTSAFPSQSVLIPVEFSVESDTISGYQLEYILDRPGVIEFIDATVIETLIVCVNPPQCTVSDTTIDTVSRVPLEAAGTLTDGWDFTSAINFGSPTFLRVTAIADLDFDDNPPPIAPPQAASLLIYLVAQVPCHPDPISGSTVLTIPNKADFTDPHGRLLSPVTTTGATFTLLEPVPGDVNLSRQVDAVDLALFIDCVLFNGCPDCDAIPVDFTYDGFPTAEDLALLIDHVFFGAAAPPPCGP